MTKIPSQIKELKQEIEEELGRFKLGFDELAVIEILSKPRFDIEDIIGHQHPFLRKLKIEEINQFREGDTPLKLINEIERQWLKIVFELKEKKVPSSGILIIRKSLCKRITLKQKFNESNLDQTELKEYSIPIFDKEVFDHTIWDVSFSSCLGLDYGCRLSQVLIIYPDFKCEFIWPDFDSIHKIRALSYIIINTPTLFEDRP